jgi:hypothetical protein
MEEIGASKSQPREEELRVYLFSQYFGNQKFQYPLGRGAIQP